MPVKKGGKKKGGKKKKKVDFVPLQLIEDIIEYVTLEIKCKNWRYQDFEVKVRTDTPVHVIKSMIEEKHGQLDSMRMYLGSIDKEGKNELKDEMMTLKECGIQGADISAEEPVRYALIYDFIPHSYDEPVLFAKNTNGLQEYGL